MPVALNLPFFELATPTADRKQFLANIGVTPEVVTERLMQTVAALGETSKTITPVFWDYQTPDTSKDRAGAAWVALKVQLPASGVTAASLPLSVEPHLIVEKLFGEAGTSVLLPLEIIPYMGGLTFYGEFLSKPSVQVRPGHRRLSVEVAELYRSMGDTNCQIMTGFAIPVNTSMWMPHLWLTTEDGAVLDTGGVHTNYFGVRLSPEAAKSFVQSWCKEGD